VKTDDEEGASESARRFGLYSDPLWGVTVGWHDLGGTPPTVADHATVSALDAAAAGRGADAPAANLGTADGGAVVEASLKSDDAGAVALRHAEQRK
jgi:hypothetical protein